MFGIPKAQLSDRRFILHCSELFDILHFIRCDTEEQLRRYCTIFNRSYLFSESLFEYVFTKVLKMCVNKGMEVDILKR